ncbi:hypothetical protein BH20ACI4_BH20ACI4_16200 [soil metagenome]
MKTLIFIICILFCSLPAFSQNKPLPQECVKILDANFPSWRYDTDWDYEKTEQRSAAYSADFNGDGKTDYGVFIEFAGQKKLVFFIKQKKGYKYSTVEKEAVLAVNSSLMNEVKTVNKNMETKFFESLPKDFIVPKDSFGMKILKGYGAVFVGKGERIVPKNVVFKNEREVSDFQKGLSISRETIGRFEIELQTAAMNALKNAIIEAAAKNLKITTRDYDAGRRSFGETVGLWYSRVEPALEFWTANGKISIFDADKLRKIPLSEQVAEIFKLEEQGIYFSKDLSKPIMYSVAPPGTSQHLSLLAIDINEYDIPAIQQLMAQNGWHQTVISDLPHFTFLGANETELPAMGLKKVISGGRFYWIPNL